MLSPIYSFKQLVNVAWLPLTPFFKSTIIFFVVRSYNFFDSNILSSILKCLPIISLIAFICFTGFSLSREHRYRQLILIGLVFSCIGDALLDCKTTNLFVEGMGAFGLAQFFFIAAFGWKPLRLLLGLTFYVFGGFGVSLLLPNLRGTLVFGVPVYIIFLLTMAWRATARVQNLQNVSKILGAFGGLIFVISDSLIAFDMFYTPIKYSNFLVISTYYIAQLGISLSVLDHESKSAKRN